MKKVGIAVLIISLVSLVAYYFLGGFEQPVISLKAAEGSAYHGRWFEGRIKNDSVRIIFEAARDYAGQHGDAVAIHYPEEIQKVSDTLRQFIGVWQETQGGQGYPTGFEPFSQEPSVSYISVLLTQHPMVMPAPDEIREMARAFAERQNLYLRSGSTELYYPDNQVEILFAVQSKP